jgi:hypothetical protein
VELVPVLLMQMDIAGVASSGMAKKCAFQKRLMSMIKNQRVQAVRQRSASENLRSRNFVNIRGFYPRGMAR